MRQTRSLVWLALSGLLAAALPAPAEDFEFEVPVQLSKLDPAFTQGRVSCGVRGIGGAGSTGQNREAVNAAIGSGSASFSIVQGGFSGSVTVKFNADRPQHEPANARSWSCVLSLVAPSGSEKLCPDDSASATNRSKGQLPAFLNLDPASVRGCTQGTIAAPK
jgi:hypothetical protein